LEHATFSVLRSVAAGDALSGAMTTTW